MQKTTRENCYCQWKITMNGMNENDRLFHLHSDFKIESFHPFLVIMAPKALFSFCYHDNFFLCSTVVFLSLFYAMELLLSNLIIIVLSFNIKVA